jgi:hypothetical protein
MSATELANTFEDTRRRPGPKMIVSPRRLGLTLDLDGRRARTRDLGRDRPTRSGRSGKPCLISGAFQTAGGGDGYSPSSSHSPSAISIRTAR